MKRKKICGIYIIKNNINNKIYIGQSIDIHKRWANHKNELKRNKHVNIHLQRAWNKYGEENFNFNILEKCNEESLSEKEINYINKYKSNIDMFGYNLTAGGEKTKINKEILLLKSKKYSKKVLQFDKQGNYIKEYQNAIFAAKELNGNNSIIYQCCINKWKSAYGYMWKFKKDCKIINGKVENISEYKKGSKSIHICQLDLKGNFIKEWENCKRAGEFYNIVSENIRSCCDKKYGRKTCIGYIWIYATEYYEKNINLHYYNRNHNEKKVAVYDLNNKYLKTYISAREVERDMKINYRSVSECCRGRIKFTHGYIFKFV